MHTTGAVSAITPRNKLILCSGILAVSFFLGCAPRAGHYDFSAGLSRTRFFIERYGQLEGPDQREYLGYLQDRLVRSLPPQENHGTRYAFVLLNHSEPLAFAPGGGVVLLSRGLIRILSNEAELAFVVAHELGHEALGHLESIADQDGLASTPALQQRLELEADAFAVNLVAAAGYDPRVASLALLKAYRSESTIAHDPSYPALRTRLSQIEDRIARSGWTPPGTIDRRDFRAFQASLRGG